ncbi:outer membrane protein [Brevundimonas goettingensis]|uniref:outer membrane protein n=1 Tax=Brevundimonas goettingensis TaxID=2774190 RepID=UPI00298F16F7|nr:outer membrane beta-barrel protein [Brevundimonas goettingensis]
MRIKSVFLASSAAAAIALSAGAASAEPDGWYGAVDAGFHTMEDGINAESQTTGNNWNFEVNDGWAAFVRLGYRFNPNWRVEVEGGYRSGDVGKIRAVTGANGVCNLTPATGGCYSPDGDIESTTLMANVIYDFGYEAWGVRPFVGIGAGVNHVNTDVVGRLRNNRTVGFAADDSSTKFAAQAIAGLAWSLSDRANIDLTYRYLTGDAEFATTTSVASYAQGTFEGDYDNSHTVTLGLRYAFGAEPVAPAGPAAVRGSAGPAAGRPRRPRVRRWLRSPPLASSSFTSTGIVRT